MKWLKKGQLPPKVKEILVSKVGNDKDGKDKSIVIYCKKKGVWFRTIKILDVKHMKFNKDTITCGIMTVLFLAEMYILIQIFH